MTEAVTTAILAEVATLAAPIYEVTMGYTYVNTLGEEVSRMFSFIVENQEQYEQFKNARLSGMPESI